MAIEATVDHDVVAVGKQDSTRLHVTYYNRGPFKASENGATWSDGRTRGCDLACDQPVPIAAGAVVSDSTQYLEDTVVSQPWWLAAPRQGDLFGVPVSRVAEDQLNEGRITSELNIDAGKQGAGGIIPVGVVHRIGDPIRGEVDHPLAGAPTISITLDQTVEYVPARTPIDRSVNVLLRSAASSDRAVAVSLALPTGLTADSAARHVIVPAYGMRRVEFRVRGTLPEGDARLAAEARTDDRLYTNGYVPIEYDHIRPQRLYRDAAVHLVAVDVKVPAGLTVGYILGVGDNVAPTLETLGIPVTLLDPANLGNIDLKKFGAIVVGTRAYQASPDLKANNRRLLDYAQNGGTLVVQYGQYEMPDGLMPYPITLARPADRVTDENAPVRILDPKSPILNTPNKITDTDWTGWVQERSTYMPRTFDDHYHPVISINDPGEPPNNAGILVASLGKGTYIYATLAFFRQLPAGNPGAARLFVNLLAAGHTQVVQ